MNVKTVKTLNTAYMCLQALYMTEACFVAGFAASFLLHRGLDNSTVGFVIASARLISFAVISLLASYLDRKKRKLYPIIFITLVLQAAACLILCGMRSSLYASAGAFILLSSTYTILGSFYTSIYTELTHAGHNVNFGLSRGIGSVVFTVVSPLVGILAANYTPNVIPYACLLIAAAMCAVTLHISRNALAGAPVSVSGEKESRSLAAFLRDNPDFLLFMLGNLLINTAYLSVMSFSVNIISYLSGGSQQLGVYNGLCSLCEIPFMIFYLRYSKNRGDKVFSLCLVFFSLKILLALLARSMPVFFLTAILQGLSYGIYTPAVVDYVQRHFSHADSIKSQSAVKLASTLGSVIGLVFTGRMLDTLPLDHVLGILALIAAAGAVAGITAVRRIAASENPVN